MLVNIMENSLNNFQLDQSLPIFAQLLIVGVELLGPLFYSWSITESRRERTAERNKRNLGSYDFIIVGGGTAGSVLANRLSEYYSVLLLEAGGTPHPLLSIPVLTYTFHGLDVIDWKWRTVPQKNASLGLKDYISYWPAGKGLGGSSNINGMIDIRGVVQGFDKIANSTGDKDWNMENLLKIYKGMEDYDGYFNNGEHGEGGTMSIGKSFLNKVTKQFLQAGEELGYPIRDPNAYGPITDGFAPMDFYIKNGRRWSAYSAYLKDIIEKRNSLYVQKYAEVTKVLLDKRNRAYGVSYIQNGRTKRAIATKEIILSGGSIQSAKLLMLSGIGPKEHLRDIGIDVKVDLPVGENLQDKYGAIVGPFLSAPGTSFLSERDLTPSTFLEWQTTGEGPVQCSVVQATNTFASSYAKKDGYANFPDIHTYFFVWSVDARYDKTIPQAFNLNNDIIYNYFAKVKGQDSFLQLVTLNQPIGHGSLKLKNNNPFSHPIIDPKYLQNKRDVEVLVEAIKFAVNLVENTKSFREVNASLIQIPLPGCEKPVFKSDDYWECIARHTTVTAYKYSATVPIGKDTSDTKAVVDSKLRVFGTTGLRVVDASVLQTRLVSVNQITVQAVAELASTFILKDWNSNEINKNNL